MSQADNYRNGSSSEHAQQAAVSVNADTGWLYTAAALDYETQQQVYHTRSFSYVCGRCLTHK